MAPDLAFERETITPEFLDEITPLAREHYAEVVLSHQARPMELDRDLYLEMGNLSLVNLYTVRDRGVLIGYCVMGIAPDPKRRGDLHAVQDALYLKPEYRGVIGERFIAFCDADIKKDGVDVIFRGVSSAHNHGAMLERNGYQLETLTFSKVVK